jgi:hypothetical protein
MHNLLVRRGKPYERVINGSRRARRTTRAQRHDFRAHEERKGGDRIRDGKRASPPYVALPLAHTKVNPAAYRILGLFDRH